MTAPTIIKMGTHIDVLLKADNGVFTKGTITKITRIRKYPTPIGIIPAVTNVKGSNPENMKKSKTKNLLVDRRIPALSFGLTGIYPSFFGCSF
jgi:hypothetical protein